MGHHRDVDQRLFELFNVNLEEFPLDPFQPKDMSRTWGLQHQIMHNNVNALLGVAGNDLTEVNWDDEGQRSAWIFLDFAEHQQWADILGVA